MTKVSSLGEGGIEVSDLEDLYVDHGLGPAQDVKGIARFTHSLELVLASPSAALAQVLPFLGSDEGT